MEAQTLEYGAAGRARRIKIRSPSSLRLKREASRNEAETAGGTGAAIYLEAFALGCLISVIAGLLPLVMLLHR
ncbi:MAG: hypothetical protein CTY15_13930 [Methylocystis sp.]|nr:MAG: hypothetical protein CTY15_13930 [Methylocystis sp.]